VFQPLGFHPVNYEVLVGAQLLLGQEPLICYDAINPLDYERVNAQQHSFI
jgi:hypothetical protein